jgi:hypothetical protein
MSQRIGRRRFLHGAAAAALHGLPWAGSLDPARPHYRRLHGSTVLIRLGQHAERRQPRPLRLARPAERLRRRLLRADYLSATTTSDAPRGRLEAVQTVSTRPPLPISRLGPRAVRQRNGVRQVFITRPPGPHMRVLKCCRYSAFSSAAVTGEYRIRPTRPVSVCHVRPVDLIIVRRTLGASSRRVVQTVDGNPGEAQG